MERTVTQVKKPVTLEALKHVAEIQEVGMTLFDVTAKMIKLHEEEAYAHCWYALHAMRPSVPVPEEIVMIWAKYNLFPKEEANVTRN